MKYRVLGTTGLKVSVVGIGTMQFGGEWGKIFSQREVGEILSASQDQGINLIDTAECYGDHLSETLIGSAIHRNRDRWIIATKFGHRYRGFMDREERWSPTEIQAQLNRSLKALRTDYKDWECLFGARSLAAA